MQLTNMNSLNVAVMLKNKLFGAARAAVPDPARVWLAAS
jgi:hypothetical protein